MEPILILNHTQLAVTIERLCHQLIENHNDFSNSAIIALQPRGVYLGRRIHANLCKILDKQAISYGELDVTFYRDDFRRKSNPLVPNATKIDFIIENKKVILVDDVLYTGRTIRAGLDAMMAFGRPQKVELLTLIDRRYSRDLPIEANYVGKSIDSIASEKVKVEWQEIDGDDRVWLMEKELKD